jgi:hypothetical protein
MADDFFGGVGDAVGNVVGTITQTAGDVFNVAADVVGGGISSFLNGSVGTNPNLLISSYRSQGIPNGAEPYYDFAPASAQFSTSPQEMDWRVKISCPLIYESPIFQPLATTSGMMFPYTPQITMSSTANYQNIDTAHTNYPFYAYKNSQVDEIQISGQFTVQDQGEATYWLAMMHFLRTVTKMYFGQGPNLGNPPPICTLNGYGDFVYNNVAVVVKQFNITMSKDVDYIAAYIGQGNTDGSNLSYVPTLSDVTVTLLPVYSRSQIKRFNLDAFSKGQLVVGPDGKGFI